MPQSPDPQPQAPSPAGGTGPRSQSAGRSFANGNAPGPDIRRGLHGEAPGQWEGLA